MIDNDDFAKILEEMTESDENREEAILISREIIKLSKLIIYAVHRGDLEGAGKLLGQIQEKVSGLPQTPHDVGMQKSALQEYVEAICFYSYVKDNLIPTHAAIGVDSECYLLGLCDLTGELVRKAVDHAIRKNKAAVLEIKDLVDEIYGKFLLLNLRNGELRKKYDSIKWNLNKLEDLSLTLS